MPWHDDAGADASQRGVWPTYCSRPVRSTGDEPTSWRMGWQCPVCKRVNAPFVVQCPCSVGMSLNTNRATSAAPEVWAVPTWSTITQSTTGNGQPQEE